MRLTKLEKVLLLCEMINLCKEGDPCAGNEKSDPRQCV